MKETHKKDPPNGSNGNKKKSASRKSNSKIGRFSVKKKRIKISHRYKKQGNKVFFRSCWAFPDQAVFNRGPPRDSFIHRPSIAQTTGEYLPHDLHKLPPEKRLMGTNEGHDPASSFAGKRQIFKGFG